MESQTSQLLRYGKVSIDTDLGIIGALKIGIPASRPTHRRRLVHDIIRPNHLGFALLLGIQEHWLGGEVHNLFLMLRRLRGHFQGLSNGGRGSGEAERRAKR